MNDLREKVAEVIRQHKQLSDRWKIMEITDQILAIFPPQLTEEEVEKILPKKLNFKMQSKFGEPINKTYVEAYNQAIDDCKTALIGKCGKVDINEKEIARIIQKYIWDWHEGCELKKDIAYKECPEECCYLFAAKKIKEALATPTFSGNDYPFTTYELGDYIHCATCNSKIKLRKPTEQKEHTHGLGVCWCGYCGDHTSLAGTGKCYQCGKPIPAEKKGCEHEWEKGITNHPDWCRKCGEPEPKDPYVSMFALYGYTKREDALSILRTNRAKEVCGDCETGDNSAQMITLDGKIWQNEKDCRKELLRRDEMFDFDKKAVAHVKVTLEVLSK